VPFYRAVGELPRKRHIQFRGPDGRLYREEEIGKEGFSSDFSILYHNDAPTDVVSVDAWELPDHGSRPNNPLMPRLLYTHKLDQGGDAVRNRRLSRPTPIYGSATSPRTVPARYTATSRVTSCTSWSRGRLA